MSKNSTTIGKNKEKISGGKPDVLSKAISEHGNFKKSTIGDRAIKNRGTTRANGRQVTGPPSGVGTLSKYPPFEQKRSYSSLGQATGTVVGGVITLGGFGINRAELKPVHTRRLLALKNEAGSLLTPQSGGFVIQVIEGYSDAVGNEEVNAFLRGMRAESVAQFLITMVGVQSEAVLIVGPAPRQKYLANNNTPEGRAQNRAVRIYFNRSDNKRVSDLAKVRDIYSKLEKLRTKNLNQIQWLDRKLTHPDSRPRKPKTLLDHGVDYVKHMTPGPPDAPWVPEDEIVKAKEEELELLDYEENYKIRRKRIQHLLEENLQIDNLLQELSVEMMNIQNGYPPSKRVIERAKSLLESNKPDPVRRDKQYKKG